MKKKILSLTLVVCLLAIAVVGGTLAYFTDTDDDTNVMTVGNVKIIQNETDRYGSPFAQEQKLVPAVFPSGTYSLDGTAPVGGYTIFDNSINGEIDKFVSVTNDGTEEAYVRTIFFFEDDAKCTLTPKVHTLWNTVNPTGEYAEGDWAPNAEGKYVNADKEKDVLWLLDEQGNYLTVTDENGKTYSVCVYTYRGAIAADETTEASLLQVWLDPSVDNDWSTKVAGEYEIYALSQAVQADGFADEFAALEAGFPMTVATVRGLV